MTWYYVRRGSVSLPDYIEGKAKGTLKEVDFVSASNPLKRDWLIIQADERPSNAENPPGNR